VDFKGLDPIFADHTGRRGGAKHQRNIGAVNIGIEKADCVS
jgi:hypothetical protein